MFHHVVHGLLGLWAQLPMGPKNHGLRGQGPLPLRFHMRRHSNILHMRKSLLIGSQGACKLFSFYTPQSLLESLHTLTALDLANVGF